MDVSLTELERYRLPMPTAIAMISSSGRCVCRSHETAHCTTLFGDRPGKRLRVYRLGRELSPTQCTVCILPSLIVFAAPSINVMPCPGMMRASGMVRASWCTASQSFLPQISENYPNEYLHGSLHFMSHLSNVPPAYSVASGMGPLNDVRPKRIACVGPMGMQDFHRAASWQ